MLCSAFKRRNVRRLYLLPLFPRILYTLSIRICTFRRFQSSRRSLHLKSGATRARSRRWLRSPIADGFRTLATCCSPGLAGTFLSKFRPRFMTTPISGLCNKSVWIKMMVSSPARINHQTSMPCILIITPVKFR